MNLHDVTIAFLDALESLSCEYILVGGIAATHYGIVRSTYDVDAVVELEGQSVQQIAARLGAAFELDPQQSFEVFTSKTMRVIRVPGTPFKIFPLAKEPFDQERFRRRARIQLEHRQVWMTTPEDLVVQKLRWARRKDLTDAQDVLAVQGDALDWPYIYRWCDEHGTRQLLEKLRSEIPPE
ncbi:MAG: DUF6036 family nucleotidyltransferase [Pirellulaceae bacterium]